MKKIFSTINEQLNQNTNYHIPQINLYSNYNKEEEIYNNLNKYLNEDLYSEIPVVYEYEEDYKNNNNVFKYFKNQQKDIQTVINNIKPSNKVTKFIQDNYNNAKYLSEKYNYPIEFILGIGRIESANGTSNGYLNNNILYNMKSVGNQASIQQKDTDKHKNSYIANYKIYNSKKESMEDFLKWCVRHNIRGNTIEELARSFADSPFAEGWGKTKEEANENLFNNYVNVIKDTQRYINK